jgi:hypothetical protein
MYSIEAVSATIASWPSAPPRPVGAEVRGDTLANPCRRRSRARARRGTGRPRAGRGACAAARRDQASATSGALAGRLRSVAAPDLVDADQAGGAEREAGASSTMLPPVESNSCEAASTNDDAGDRGVEDAAVELAETRRCRSADRGTGARRSTRAAPRSPATATAPMIPAAVCPPGDRDDGERNQRKDREVPAFFTQQNLEQCLELRVRCLDGAPRRRVPRLALRSLVARRPGRGLRQLVFERCQRRPRLPRPPLPRCSCWRARFLDSSPLP